MMFIAFVFLLLLLHITNIHGHGYLADPPARSSAWLFDEDFARCCQYYNHLQMSCGGMYHQWSVNGGKCSICGEPYDLEPKLFGVGDSMYLGKIVRTYTQGSTIPVTVVLTANHLGLFEFRVCSIDNDPNEDATQSCLNLNLLKVTKTSTEFPIEASFTTVHVNVTLPANLVCKHCVFQWKYRTGNSWGVSISGRGCLGCGRQNEEFYGCSDISIVSSSRTTDNSSASVSSEILNSITTVTEDVQAPPPNCTSAVVFSQSYDLSTIMQQYCQQICPNNCAMDKSDASETIYEGCVKSCNILCTCQ